MQKHQKHRELPTATLHFQPTVSLPQNQLQNEQADPKVQEKQRSIENEDQSQSMKSSINMKLDYNKPLQHRPRKGSSLLEVQKQPALAPLALTSKLHESRGSLQNPEININTASTQDRALVKNTTMNTPITIDKFI